MVRPPRFDSNGMKKGAWSQEEDDKLRAYVLRYGHWNWRLLPKYAGLARCGKSCRLRWVNYLKPGLKRGDFSKPEEDIIIQLHAQLGNKWSTIAAKLPGRTDNEIKNYWHTRMQKHKHKHQRRTRKSSASKKKKQLAVNVQTSTDDDDDGASSARDAHDKELVNAAGGDSAIKQQQQLQQPLMPPAADHVIINTNKPAGSTVQPPKMSVDADHQQQHKYSATQVETWPDIFTPLDIPSEEYHIHGSSFHSDLHQFQWMMNWDSSYLMSGLDHHHWNINIGVGVDETSIYGSVI